MKTPEEFWESLNGLPPNHDGHEIDAITERDAAIRLEAREEHRLEVVAEMERQRETWRVSSEEARQYVQQFCRELNNLDCLQPPKPKVHPRALALAKQIIPDDVPLDTTAPCGGMTGSTYYILKPAAERQQDLAALISSEVKADGWKE